MCWKTGWQDFCTAICHKLVTSKTGIGRRNIRWMLLSVWNSQRGEKFIIALDAYMQKEYFQKTR